MKIRLNLERFKRILAYQKQYHLRRRIERIMNGICTRCGDAAPKPGRRECAPCLDHKNHPTHAISHKRMGISQTSALSTSCSNHTK